MRTRADAVVKSSGDRFNQPSQSTTVVGMSDLTYQQLHDATSFVLDALSGIGETWCCVVGGMAIRLNGRQRTVAVRTLPNIDNIL